MVSLSKLSQQFGSFPDSLLLERSMRFNMVTLHKEEIGPENKLSLRISAMVSRGNIGKLPEKLFGPISIKEPTWNGVTDSSIRDIKDKEILLCFKPSQERAPQFTRRQRDDIELKRCPDRVLKLASCTTDQGILNEKDWQHEVKSRLVGSRIDQQVARMSQEGCQKDLEDLGPDCSQIDEVHARVEVEQPHVYRRGWKVVRINIENRKGTGQVGQRVKKRVRGVVWKQTVYKPQLYKGRQFDGSFKQANLAAEIYIAKMQLIRCWKA
ncbi:hypothetical protein L1987_80786 [Smallanthus sonchifolius]|uniref:Uncharacterized protein n=1 Tax=Smallanthus sonchifolius TaxID=185202 RepID=A0ACB8YNN1_9ASTR|nr:hypothetical protein L1987_80786 [Smallanthus sonchifolius]